MESDVLWKHQRHTDLNRLSRRSEIEKTVSMSRMQNADNATVHSILGIQMRGQKRMNIIY